MQLCIYVYRLIEICKSIETQIVVEFMYETKHRRSCICVESKSKQAGSLQSDRDRRFYTVYTYMLIYCLLSFLKEAKYNLSTLYF